MKKDNAAFGMVGLGVMGRNLLLNMADHGFAVTGYDRDLAKVDALARKARSPGAIAKKAQEFSRRLDKPRKIMLLVPAGEPVDAVIAEFCQLLSLGPDHRWRQLLFRDTERR